MKRASNPFSEVQASIPEVHKAKEQSTVENEANKNQPSELDKIEDYSSSVHEVFKEEEIKSKKINLAKSKVTTGTSVRLSAKERVDLENLKIRFENINIKYSIKEYLRSSLKILTDKPEATQFKILEFLQNTISSRVAIAQKTLSCRLYVSDLDQMNAIQNLHEDSQIKFTIRMLIVFGIEQTRRMSDGELITYYAEDIPTDQKVDDLFKF